VRLCTCPEVIFGLEPDAAAAKVNSVVGPVIEAAGLPVALLQEYRWYVAELCRLMRMTSGPDLAYCMEFVIKKWLGFGLEPNTVVYLANALFDRLQTKPDTESPESRIQSAETGVAAGQKNEGRTGAEAESPESRIQNAESRVAGPQPKSEDRGQNAEGRSAEPEECLPRKHEGHEEASESGTGLLESSTPGILPSVNDGRRTRDDETSRGGGP